MQRNIFSPKVQDPADDVLSSFFYKTSQIILMIVLGLVPVFFVPGVYAALGFTKIFFLTIGIFAALIFACLAALRSGEIRTYLPLPLLFFWLFSLFAVVSALLSGDSQDSLFGVAFEVGTAGFLVLMSTVMTISLVISGSKKSFSRFFWLSLASASVVLVLYILRLIFGVDFLSFGIFNSNSISAIGSLNDLALYAGLIIMVILVATPRLASSLLIMSAVSVLTLASLFVISVSNFSSVWMTIGFASLLTFLYLVAKDTWLKSAEDESPALPTNRFVLVLVAVICLVSGAFIVSGDYLGGKISNMTGVSYLEVRPSLTATFDVTRNVYKNNILFGTGPNRFEDAWRQYKDPVINGTQFWNTNFSSGNSFVSTLFVTTGLLGTIIFLVFILSFLHLGYKLIFLSKSKNPTWNFVGLVSFTAAIYLWLMTFLYTPGTAIMLLAAIATGFTFAVWVNFRPDAGIVINVAHSRQHGFLLIASALVVIVSSTVVFIKLNKQYASQVMFSEAIVELSSSGNVDSYDKALVKVSGYDDKQDIYVSERARLRLAELNRLRSIAEPTENDQTLYVKALEEGIGLADLAVKLDATNPYNQALHGSFYGLVDSSANEAVQARRDGAFANAKKLDPTNPEYYVLEAQIASQSGDFTKARENLNQAVNLKGNYTDALFMLSQLDIQEGNATSAIATTLAIISIEPYNPGRYFQLGLLLLSNSNLSDAILAFEAAVQLDTNYANARYMLALSYLDTNRIADALEQLKIVQISNPENQELSGLIAQVENGETVKTNELNGVPVKDPNATSQDGEATVANEAPDTDLVTPVNRVPKAPAGENNNPAPANASGEGEETTLP